MSNDIVKVFVGCDPNNCDLEQMMVLEYSIKKHSSLPVDITWMQLSKDENSVWYANPEQQAGWNTKKWATPFSGFRWAIPEYCNYQGRAIYMDADVIVLSDIAEMWHHPINGKAIVAAKTNADMTRLCTCVWDCAAAKEWLLPLSQLTTDPDAHQTMMDTIKAHPELVQPYQDSYNCVDGEDLPVADIKVLHYSDMGTQFSHRYALPRVEKEGFAHWFDGTVMPHPRPELDALFDRYYEEALAAGYTLEDYRIPAFGAFPKKTHKRYKGNKVTRTHTPKSLFARLFNR